MTTFENMSGRIPYRVIEKAIHGDTEAISLISSYYDPYIRTLATVTMKGVTYLNMDLYERLKAKLLISILKFKI